MEVRIADSRSNGICTVKISFVYTKTEKEKLGKIGYPSIETGGNFGEYSLPTSVKKFSQSPFSQSFDGIELGHDLAVTRARTYTTVMNSRVRSVWENFKAIPDDFSGETVYTL